ncbi:MAG TPA: YaiO family outer membrane beta-barrel protein [Verrucomicrobiae bacterium]|jgi:YaiO family outer membrane protein|nr:YaiO family outer membrane beta-barrel protein [Verrucomicrobiae bacterium]
MKSFLAFTFALTVLYAVPALADQPATTVDLSASSVGFSPGSIYGPWQYVTLVARGVAGANDKPGITLVTRTDRDLDYGSGSTVVVDDYHQFSPRLSAYASVQLSSGNLFPTRGAFLELDPVVATGLVAGFGYGVLATPDGLSQRYASIGPTLYFPHGNATLRYLPTWTLGQVFVSALYGNLSLGDEGRAVTSLTLQDGVEPAFDVNDPTSARRFQERTFVANLDYKRWLTPRLGYDLGVEYGHQVDRITGADVYTRRGFTLGFFFGIGHSPTAL